MVLSRPGTITHSSGGVMAGHILEQNTNTTITICSRLIYANDLRHVFVPISPWPHTVIWLFLFLHADIMYGLIIFTHNRLNQELNNQGQTTTIRQKEVIEARCCQQSAPGFGQNSCLHTVLGFTSFLNVHNVLLKTEWCYSTISRIW